MEDFLYFLLALAIWSFPFLVSLWLVRKTTVAKQVVLFLFLLILPFGFAAWVFCAMACSYVRWLVSCIDRPTTA